MMGNRRLTIDEREKLKLEVAAAWVRWSIAEQDYQLSRASAERQQKEATALYVRWRELSAQLDYSNFDVDPEDMNFISFFLNFVIIPERLEP